MRARLGLLGVSLGVGLGVGLVGLGLAACSTGANDSFAELDTLKDVTLGSSSSSAGPGAVTTGAPEPTTGASTEAVTTGLPETSTSADPTADPTLTGDPSGATTGLEMTTAGPGETGPDETGPGETGETGGPPADCPRVRVNTPGDVANVRPQPSTAMAPVGTLANGTLVDVVAIVQGEAVDGNSQWVQIESPKVNGYIWGGLAVCTSDMPSADGFFLPLPCGMTATISQGNNGEFSHNGNSAWAFDFSLGSGTSLVAIADGTVSHVYADTKPGDPCYNGGGKECNAAANYVQLVHGDGTSSIYGHLSVVGVNIGDFVKRGNSIGLSGSTGWSTGRHAHVARQEACAWGWCQSIPVSFKDVPGDGVPVTGQSVTSGNCP